MKILCRVKPDFDTCCVCVDEQIDGKKSEMECEDCFARIPYCEVLQLGHSFWKGDWAMVLMDEGKIKRVELKRVFDVKTEHRLGDGFQRGFRAMAHAIDDYAKHQIFEDHKED